MSPRAPNVSPGQQLPSLTVHVDRQRLLAYSAASGDDNPIHQDEEFARSVGLPDVIAHGMFTMGAAIEAVTDWLGDPARVVSYSTRFTKPVVVPADGGTDIQVEAEVKSIDEQTQRASIALRVTNDGVAVLGKAVAVVDLG